MKAFFFIVFFALTAKAMCQNFSTHARFASLEWDNDAFSSRDKTDANYTNGIRFTYMSSGELAQNKWWFNWILFNARQQTHSMNGFQFGQEMYTPSDLAVTDPLLMDRPYSGYLYLKSQRVSSSRLIGQRITSSNSFGLFGGWSKAECVQKFIHNRLDLGKPPLGWETGTTRNELVVLDYQFMIEGRFLSGLYSKIQSWLGHGSSGSANEPIHKNFDVISFLQTRVGQVKNELAVGGLIKLGWFNNHFVSTLPVFENDNRYRYRLDSNTTGNVHKGKIFSNWYQNTQGGIYRPHQIYMFARPSLNVVASNAHLQGGTLNSLLFSNKVGEPHNTIESSRLNRYVPSLDYGLVLNVSRVTFTYTASYRFPEFNGNTAHKWGSFQLSYLY